MLPTGSVDVPTLALPPDNVTVPSTTEPEVNVTVPVGVVVGEDTVAVNLTICPAVEGFFDDTIVVVVTA